MKRVLRLVEYGLLLSLVAVVCIAAITLLGSNISTMLSNLASHDLSDPGSLSAFPTSLHMPDRVMKAEQGGVREVRYRSNFSEPRGTSMTLLVAAACELNRERWVPRCPNTPSFSC